MDIVNAVLSIWTTISNWFWILLKTIGNIFSTILTLVNNIIDIIGALLYWFGSIMSWLWDLIVQVFDWWVFTTVGRMFDMLSQYLWAPAVIFMSTLFLIIVFRIFIAFIFKFFRLNIDYSNTLFSSKKIYKK